MKEVLTASRISSMMSCPRRHYWRYECGLHKEEDAMPLRFGSAWHRGMEARWKNATSQEVFTAAIGDDDFDELTVATLTAMLRAYYDYYGMETQIDELHPEVEFIHPIDGSRVFDAAGKIDGVGTLTDGRLAMVEHKTTSASLDSDSDYWLRLRANVQVYQYVKALRVEGWDVGTVIYDVVRKPGLRPRNIPLLDEDGFKIVLDNDSGERVYLANGKPRQAASEGMTLQTTEETPEEFEARLYQDIMLRPEYYFARREVPVLDDDLEAFDDMQVQVARMILDRRRQQKMMPDRPERAWPRHLSGFSCPGCEYASFCLQNTIPDLAHPPAGYAISKPHTELEEVA